ncbi:MAG: T9SS type A sorting domain-containing protein [Candidatus Cloacimonetes bacterium]|nr:T9SS type A sorting domain-containing protein [Candidatus Cloacimonadota bacterium]
MKKVMHPTLCLIVLFLTTSLYGIPDWEFLIEPTPIMETWYDYPPNDLSGTSVIMQNCNYPGNNSSYIMFLAAETATEPVRQRYAYFSPEGTLNTQAPLSTDSIADGPGSMAMDFDTQDPFFAWSSDANQDGIDEVLLCYDMWHVLQGPGLITTPAVLAPNGCWPAGGFTPPNADDEFVGPRIFVVNSPTYDTDGTRRLYVFCSNRTLEQGYPRNNVLFGWTDFDTSDIDNGCVGDSWNFSTFPQLDAWAEYPAQNRLHYSATVSQDGKLAIMGYIEPGPAGLNLEDPDVFVLYNDNFGEGDWELHIANSELYPPIPTGGPRGFIDALQDAWFSFRYSANVNISFDAEGRISMPVIYGLHASGTYQQSQWNQWNQLRNIVFDPDDDIWTNQLAYPGQSDDLYALHLPWDTDGDGEVDITPDGQLDTEPLWPYGWYGGPGDITSACSSMNILSNQCYTQALIWTDATNAHRFWALGESGLSLWAQVPELCISVRISDYWEWENPIRLNAIDIPEMTGLVPMYVFPRKEFIYLGDNQFRLDFLFYDDYWWGIGSAPTQNPTGQLYFCSLMIENWVWCELGDSSSLPQLLGAFPNPFNPETTIGFSLPVSGQVELTVYNVRGERVKTLVNGDMKPGDHTVTWQGSDDNGSPVASGVYFYRLQAGGNTETRKMLLLK